MKELIDEIIITVRSGRGGKGLESFQKMSRIKMMPIGGNGGKGGDVIFEADTNVFDLESYRYNKLFQAEDGDPGGKNNCTGHNAKDLILKVPVGTIVYDAKNHLCMRQLLEPNDRLIAVKGGKGGIGNYNKRHGKHDGISGEEALVLLEYFYVSDVCLVGYPNSGKSQFLTQVSHSKAKVTDYAFSTRIPSLGSYVTEKYFKMVFCEIPSIMKGSSEGKGLGNKFLKHMKHAKINAYFLDAASPFEPDPLKQLHYLKEEIEGVDATLLEKTEIAILNKSDLVSAAEIKKMEKKIEKKMPVYSISALEKTGFAPLLKYFEKQLKP